MVARWAVLFLLCGSVAFGQAVTNVDVTVTDGKGVPVHGLGVADFEVVERGQVRGVDSVAEVTAESGVARRMVVLIDASTMTLGRRKVAISAIKDWLSRELRPTDSVAVVTAIPTLRTKLPFSNDKAAILAALDVAGKESLGNSEQDRRRAESLMQDIVNRAARMEETDPFKPSFDDLMRVGRSYAASALRDADAVASTIGTTLATFSSLPEKKVLILAGEGLPKNPGYDMFMYLNTVKHSIESNGPELLIASARVASPLTEASQYDIFPTLSAVVKSARLRGVVVYAINPGNNEDTSGAVEHTRPLDVSTGFARTTSGMTGYQYLSKETGGLAFAGTPPAKALERVSSDIGSYYTLAFAGDPAHVTIRSKHDGHRIRTTLASATMTLDERMGELVRSHHLTSPASNDLKIDVVADASRGTGRDRVVPVRVMIPIDKLKIEPAGTEVTGSFSVYIVAGTATGAAGQISKQRHEIRWPPGALEHGRGKSMTYMLEVLLPPGYNQISVGVVDDKTEQTGFERITISG